jgi:hypothetical protein
VSLASLAGVDVLTGRLVVPAAGLWHADLVLVDVGAPLSGLLTLSLAGASWLCAAIRSIDFAGRRGVRVIAGLARWGTIIGPKQYGDGTVPVAAVLQDAAHAAGELAPDTSGATGRLPGYARARGPASMALQTLLVDGWWADMSGRVQTLPRPTVAVSSDFQALDVDGPSGVYEIATESPNDWLPDVTFVSPTVSGTVSRVEHQIEPTSMRTMVMV